MPTFDGGHYFLTVLIPVKTHPISDESAFTSPVHALRKRLAMLAPAAQTPACSGGQSPFARNTRNHFARFVVIDDVAYNGRLQPNTLWTTLRGLNPIVAQPQDHLSCPFLLYVTDFDAASGADSERDSFLMLLWDTMGRELGEILTYCEGFDLDVNDAASFARYIASCQVETTMPFNDYYVDPPALPIWSPEGFKIAGIAGLSGLALGLAVMVLFDAWAGFILALLGVATIIGVAAKAYISIMAAGAKPFPAAPDSNLATVLKALHLQRAFMRFAIANQVRAAKTDLASAQQLYDDFATFVGVNSFVDVNPSDGFGEPTQKPGVIGI
jgi:hypothetical protein